MPNRHDEPTGDELTERSTGDRTLSRRRVLQIGGVGVSMATLGAAGVSAGSTELPNAVVIDGSGASDPAAYELLVSGEAAVHPELGTNESGDRIDGGHVVGEVGTDLHAYRFSGTLSYLDVDGTAEVSLLYGDEPPTTADRLEIVAPSDGEVAYRIETADPVTKVLAETENPADAEDSVTEADDGTWLVDGATRNGGGDTYDFAGSIDRIEPVTGDFTLFFNGQETTVTELTGQEVTEEEPADPVPDREHWYSFEATGDEYADYYIEVEDGGDMVPSTVDGAVVEDGSHWVNDDGTKAAGRVRPGDTHAFAFDTLVADVTVVGEAAATVDGSDSSLDYYPRDSATGDHWKGYFPWQIAGEERTHWYSFEATGDEYADYYIEVEDGGDLIPSTVDDATVEYEFFWIGDGGTKAAGRIDPGETHAFAFDTLVADVTVEGDAATTVNGNDSSLDYYPRDSATGDAWKTGFPWQDDDHSASTTAPDGVAMGGGPGYGRIVTSADADAVVDTASGLSDALSGASAGDVVFVDGGATIDTGGRSMDVPDGVTLASNRGEGGAPGALLYTDETPQIMLRPQTDARVTGLRLRGHSPDRTVTYRDGISFDTPTYALSLEGGDVEVDNCEVWGWPDRAVAVKRSRGHVHHNYIYDNNGQGLGYGVAANEECLIEYNYFHNNRHSVTCAYDAPGYTARYNHFSPVSVMHICDIHDPFEGDTTIESNVVENGESRTWDNPAAEGVAGYSGGFDGGSLAVADNWFFDEGSAYFDSFAAVSDGGNVYGGEGSHDPADVIPEHPGMADRPWL